MKKRIFVAVDGSNLYHRLKEERVDLHNLLNFDYTGFAKFLAGKENLPTNITMLAWCELNRARDMPKNYAATSKNYFSTLKSPVGRLSVASS